MPEALKGNSQLRDRADLDTPFASLTKASIKCTRRLHLEIRFNLALCFIRFAILYRKPLFEQTLTHFMIFFIIFG